VAHILKEDFDACGVFIIPIAAEQELSHADRITPELKASFTAEAVQSGSGCHPTIIGL
jgi:hypothetical protein